MHYWRPEEVHRGPQLSTAWALTGGIAVLRGHTLAHRECVGVRVTQLALRLWGRQGFGLGSLSVSPGVVVFAVRACDAIHDRHVLLSRHPLEEEEAGAERHWEPAWEETLHPPHPRGALGSAHWACPSGNKLPQAQGTNPTSICSQKPRTHPHKWCQLRGHWKGLGPGNGVRDDQVGLRG
jgi:hypothetical protein